ncbi:MAG TPA: lipocalin family protein [Saprospiraceae bacterium]|nr:lipocalin family protein [Saprospiraceae bacterium]
MATRIFILLNLFLILSCVSETSQDPNKLIVNTWKLTEFTPAPQFTMPDSVRQEIIAKTVVEFAADKKFKQTGIGRTHTGTYNISKDGKQITYYHDQKDVPFTETVLELTSKRMSVVDQNGNRMVRKN